MSKNQIIIADYSDASQPLTLVELVSVVGVETTFIYELVEFDVLQPEGNAPEQWLFDLIALQRAKTALRLKRDLEVNAAGIAVILDLLEQIEMLKKSQRK